MVKIKTILFYYNIIFIFCLLIAGVYNKNIFNSPALLIVVVPLIIYFYGYLIFNSKKFKIPNNQSFWIFVSLLIIFNILSTSLLFVSSITFSQSITDIFISLFYLPIPTYFFLTIFGWYQKIIKNNKVVVSTVPVNTTKVDTDRRRFLKILGGTGVSIFLMSLINPKQAGAAFFGSVPGPGTVSLKDATGTKINPAEKHATDGYKISKVDDTSSDTYAYYGFIDQNSRWYIQRETTSGVNVGDFLYCKGDSAFAVSWGLRSALTYNYFDSIF